jgi:hypothetical protein
LLGDGLNRGDLIVPGIPTSGEVPLLTSQNPAVMRDGALVDSFDI